MDRVGSLHGLRKDSAWWAFAAVANYAERAFMYIIEGTLPSRSLLTLSCWNINWKSFFPDEVVRVLAHALVLFSCADIKAEYTAWESRCMVETADIEQK
mgnify:CR=1 FL=1